MGKVVLTEGEVMVVDVVDAAEMTYALANRRKKRLRPVLTLRPSIMMAMSINSSVQPREPNIGNLCIRINSLEAWSVDVEEAAELPRTAAGIPIATAAQCHPLYPKPAPNVASMKLRLTMTQTCSRQLTTKRRSRTEIIKP